MEKQPTPRKGTETFRDARMLCHCGNNPHPARGRKPKFVILLPSYYETTHTPQGDGNPLFSGIAPAILRNNPHPARGRKPLIARGGGSALTETTHTPQGDGNLDGIEPVADLGRNNPHPARGRKLTINQYRACIAGNNPHPARGRKTICVHIAEIVGETIHIPDRGQLTKKERETP